MLLPQGRCPVEDVRSGWKVGSRTCPIAAVASHQPGSGEACRLVQGETWNPYAQEFAQPSRQLRCPNPRTYTCIRRQCPDPRKCRKWNRQGRSMRWRRRRRLAVGPAGDHPHPQKPAAAGRSCRGAGARPLPKERHREGLSRTAHCRIEDAARGVGGPPPLAADQGRTLQKSAQHHERWAEGVLQEQEFVSNRSR